MNQDDAVAALVAGVSFLKQHGESTGKVGAVGFCFGGLMVNRLAVSSGELDAGVAYYGRQVPAADVPKIKAALMLHYAENDEGVNAGIAAYEAALKRTTRATPSTSIRARSTPSTTTSAPRATTRRRPTSPGAARSRSSSSTSGRRARPDRHFGSPSGVRTWPGRIIRTGAVREPQVAPDGRNVALNRMFDWNDLRYFLAVAREGSTIAAADALKVNQSTVQRRLAALEEKLGRQLVERSPAGYRLTETGLKLRPHAEAVEAAVEAFRRQIASAATELTGTIRVTSAEGIAYLVLTPLLEKFHVRLSGPERRCDPDRPHARSCRKAKRTSRCAPGRCRTAC